MVGTYNINVVMFPRWGPWKIPRRGPWEIHEGVRGKFHEGVRGKFHEGVRGNFHSVFYRMVIYNPSGTLYILVPPVYLLRKYKLFP